MRKMRTENKTNLNSILNFADSQPKGGTTPELIRLQAGAAAPVDLDRCGMVARANHLRFLPKPRRWLLDAL